MQELFFERNGKRIFYRKWDNVVIPKGVIQIVHGMVEHTLRYDKVAARLNKEGYIVVGEDHRGHGNTDPDTLGYSEGDMYENTLLDVHYLMEITKKEYPDLPYFLFGFSYGSFLAQSFLGRYMDEVDGVIIGGTNFQPHGVAVFGKVVASLGCTFLKPTAPAKLMKALTFDAYNAKFKEGEFLSVNEESNRRYHADKYCSYICSYNFYKYFMNGLTKLYSKEYAAKLKKDVPVLIVSGRDDPVGDMSKGPKKLHAYLKKQGVEQVDLILYDNSRHEFLNEELDRINDIISFCNKAIAK